jgi:BCD family chlorophyll transporter-like MFS transporter
MRDIVDAAAMAGTFGPGMQNATTGYSVVYHIEIYLLFATLIAVGPLVRTRRTADQQQTGHIGLADFPT